MSKAFFSLLLTLSFTFSSYSKDLPTVEYVDINQYVGKWYTISTLPQIFTINCRAQTAEYDIVNQSKISILNTCIPKIFGKTTVKGFGEVTDFKTFSKLDIKFDTWWARFFGAKGKYYILKLDREYRHVLVGEPTLKSLWIMSRTPQMDSQTYKEYVDYAKDLGFDTSKLVKSKF